MNTFNTLPESYQQRVYKDTPATVKSQIQQADDPTPAKVISMEAADVDNANHLDNWTSKVALEEREIGSTDSIFRYTTIVRMTTMILGCQGAARITKMEMTTLTSEMLSPPPVGEHGLQLNPSGLTCEPAMSTGMRATRATMQMWMRRMKHLKPMMDQCRIWRTEGIILETEGIVLETVKIGEYISDQ